MKAKIIAVAFSILVISNCTAVRNSKATPYNFSLKNTLSVFMLNNEKGFYLCFPVQYHGNYQISGFNFTQGDIQFSDYTIPLQKENINIYIYLNETQDENGSSIDNFYPVYIEEYGDLTVSKLSEPLTSIDVSDNTYNHYYIFIERYLTDNELKNIINEYEKGNVNARFSIWYDIIIDNIEQKGSGLLDDFELYNGIAYDTSVFPQNLNFFKIKYLQ